MIEERVQTVQKFQTDDWREALAFLLIVLRKNAANGEDPEEWIYTGIYKILKLANERGWEFTAEQTIGFCINEENDVDSVESLPLALEAGGFLSEKDFDKIFAETEREGGENDEAVDRITKI